MYDSSVLHDRCYVCEVQIDQCIVYYDIGDTLHSLFQDLICHFKCFQQRSLFLYRFQELIIRYNNEGIHVLLQELDSKFCMLAAFFSFKTERLGYYPYRKNPHVLGDFSDDRRSTCSCASSHTACHEDHVGSCNEFLQIFQIFFCRFLPYFRVPAGTQTFRQFFSDLNLCFRLAFC